MKMKNLNGKKFLILWINDDKNRYIKINLEDRTILSQILDLYQKLSEKQNNLQMLEHKDMQLLNNAQRDFAICVIEGIDSIFGKGTHYRLFRNEFDLDAYSQLFDGISKRLMSISVKRKNMVGLFRR